MSTRLTLAILLLVYFPAEALACRCAQQPLSHYFDAADFVAMGKLISSEKQGDNNLLNFELLSIPYKGDAAGQDNVQVVSASSGASCGVYPDVGAVYVLFGSTDAEGSDHYRVDSCNGTRMHLSTALEEPVGFVDVPARFVASQLNALAGLEVLREVTDKAPQPGNPGNDKLIGLLDLKVLAHGGTTSLYESPCRGSRVLAEIDGWEDVEHRELGYEVSAAVVVAIAPGWYRLRSNTGEYGWVAAGDAGTWFPYPELPVRRLAYLTEGWSGLAWPSPGAGNPLRFDLRQFSDPKEIAVNLLETTEIAGFPWFRVEILSASPCGGDATEPKGTGWVPAYNRAGKPSVWFFSRGC